MLPILKMGKITLWTRGRYPDMDLSWGFRSSEIWLCHVFRQVVADLSNDYSASIFMGQAALDWLTREDKRSTIPHVGNCSPNEIASLSTRPQSSAIPLSEHEFSYKSFLVLRARTHINLWSDNYPVLTSLRSRGVSRTIPSIMTADSIIYPTKVPLTRVVFAGVMATYHISDTKTTQITVTTCKKLFSWCDVTSVLTLS